MQNLLPDDIKVCKFPSLLGPQISHFSKKKKKNSMSLSEQLKRPKLASIYNLKCSGLQKNFSPNCHLRPF